jgi:murein DD-endopeptidase MepM/ murein hydrolase activator NlpD
MKKLLVVFAVGLLGLLAWIAAGPNEHVSTMATRAIGAPGGNAPNTPDRRTRELPLAASSLPAVPPVVMAPIATATAPPPGMVDATTPVMWDPDAPRPMIVPVIGVERAALRDMFDEARGKRRHEAIDILAPRGTPVVATDDGVVTKLFTSVPGGLTVYEFDPDQRFCYYYAHLDRYADGLHEGQLLHRGDLLGYVGTTGNAPKDTPHLHFALIRLDADHRWWKGTYVNPYPMLAAGR